MLLLVPEAPRESGVQGQGRGGRGAHGGSLPPGSRRGEGAHPALSRAAEAYEAITAPALATFWTVCAGCHLLHEFVRKYVGYRLTCPSCRRTFLAVEVLPRAAI